MTRYKGRRRLKSTEREFPHSVVLLVPEGGFGRRLDAMHDWFAARGIDGIGGRGEKREDRDYISWCFADPQTADDFAAAFGGSRRG